MRGGGGGGGGGEGLGNNNDVDKTESAILSFSFSLFEGLQFPWSSRACCRVAGERSRVFESRGGDIVLVGLRLTWVGDDLTGWRPHDCRWARERKRKSQMLHSRKVHMAIVELRER